MIEVTREHGHQDDWPGMAGWIVGEDGTLTLTDPSGEAFVTYSAMSWERATDSKVWEIGAEPRPRTTVLSNHTLKSIREAMCLAQAALGHAGTDQMMHASDVLADLICDIDRQRPLGPNGKHGDLHTRDCQCDDVQINSGMHVRPLRTDKMGDPDD